MIKQKNLKQRYCRTRRGSCKSCRKAFEELAASNPHALHPVYVIGSEVPIPGGSQGEEEQLQVTSPDDFRETVNLFREEFYRNNLDSAWENVIAIVVQPGVEFGDDSIHEYDRNAAEELCKELKNYRVSFLKAIPLIIRRLKL